MLLRRQLGNDYRREHYRTADIFNNRHALAENDERENDRENGFGAKQHARKGRLGIFLTDDLERERTAAAHYTGVENRNCGLHDSVYARLFEDEHENARNYTCYHVLAAGKNYCINL